MYRGSRGKGRGPIFDRRNIEARLRTRSEETERAQREEMEQRAQIEEMEQREKEIADARGLPTNRGRGPGRWNTAGERLNMLAASEAPVPEYVPGAAAAASAAPEQEISQEERVRAHIKYMEDLEKGARLLLFNTRIPRIIIKTIALVTQQEIFLLATIILDREKQDLSLHYRLKLKHTKKVKSGMRI